MPYAEFRAFIDTHDDFLILSHIDPDGDALGSSLGLYWALRSVGKNAVVANDSPVPANLVFLPGASEIRLTHDLAGEASDVKRQFRSVFVLDCSSIDRVGPAGMALVAPDAHVACVDHHAGSDGFGNPRLVNVDASATAELIYEILEDYGLPITPEIAEALYTGIASDTGAFRFRNTTSRVLRLAARLVERGADPSRTAESLFGRKSAASLRVLGLALASLESRAGGKVSALTISRAMFDEAKASSEDADGIVQYAQTVNGARVGVLLQETAPGEVRISFRSDGSVDVNLVAGRFGGGGHRNAAGARLRGDLNVVRESVLVALEQAVNGGPPAPRG
jgi:bifunctional oligoribonuclease and PAP phosphatase NrnA